MTFMPSLTGRRKPARHARTSNTGLAALLDAEIKRYQQGYAGPQSLVPCFPPALERKFDADTRKARSRDLVFTIGLGTFFYLLSTLTDFAFVPDTGFDGFALRLAILPMLIAAMFYVPRMRSTHRENLVAIVALTVVGTLTLIPSFSGAQHAAFAFTTAMLALVYANTTLGLRFRTARAFTVLSCLLIIAMALLHSQETSAVGWAITLQVIVAGAFSLLANYRIERNARLGYLLNEREALRLTALAADREQLRTLSNTDALTGVSNRGSFNRRCAAAFTDPENFGSDAALLMIDVDHFKQFNDYYGHLAGDDCLRIVARQISNTIRGNDDIVARYGGEEFVVFLRGVSLSSAAVLANRLCAAVCELDIPHLGRGDSTSHVTISVGVATTVMEGSNSLLELIEAADRALYAAKRKGRNRCEAALSRAA